MRIGGVRLFRCTKKVWEAHRPLQLFLWGAFHFPASDILRELSMHETPDAKKLPGREKQDLHMVMPPLSEKNIVYFRRVCANIRCAFFRKRRNRYHYFSINQSAINHHDIFTQNIREYFHYLKIVNWTSIALSFICFRKCKYFIWRYNIMQWNESHHIFIYDPFQSPIHKCLFNQINE